MMNYTLRFFRNKWIYIKLLFQSLTFAILSASLCVKKRLRDQTEKYAIQEKKKKKPSTKNNEH